MMQNDIRIRTANKTDTEEISILARNNCRNPWRKEQFEEELGYDFSLLYVLSINGEISGFSCIHITEPEAHLNEIAVSAEFRRAGFGSKLLSFGIEEAIKKGCTYMTLEVRESNIDAINFYEYHGFYKVGIRPRIYSEPSEPGLIMKVDFYDYFRN